MLVYRVKGNVLTLVRLRQS
nr:hypothetical protein [Helicobacter pylori]